MSQELLVEQLVRIRKKAENLLSDRENIDSLASKNSDVKKIILFSEILRNGFSPLPTPEFIQEIENILSKVEIAMLSRIATRVNRLLSGDKRFQLNEATDEDRGNDIGYLLKFHWLAENDFAVMPDDDLLQTVREILSQSEKKNLLQSTIDRIRSLNPFRKKN